MSTPDLQFNPAPGWPVPPQGWSPPAGWTPKPEWPPAPPGWQFWVVDASPPDQIGDGEIAVSADDNQGDVATSEQSSSSSAGVDGSDDFGEPPTPHRREDALDLSPVTKPHPAAEAETTEDMEAATSPAMESKATPQIATRHSTPANTELARIARERDRLALEVERLREQQEGLDELAEVGIYRFKHPLDSSAEYKAALEEIRVEIKELIRTGHAIETSDRFAYNNSLAQGRRMTGDLAKLMMRAYNAEADMCVRTVRAGASATSLARLDRAVNTIAKLGKMMEMRVSSDYHALRTREIELTDDFLKKVQIEREEAREERERLREERKAEKELAAERERLEKERSHYSNAIDSLRGQGKTQAADELADRIADLDRAIAANDFRAANIRAGYVYVISNVGSFGGDVVKIGMTRRLEPLDRVKELGDASVPFPFDVHAIYFSDDAVSLENSLHKTFSQARLNQVNLRREFFYATPEQVKAALRNQVGNLLEFTDEVDADQYRQSITLRNQLVTQSQIPSPTIGD